MKTALKRIAVVILLWLVAVYVFKFSGAQGVLIAIIFGSLLEISKLLDKTVKSEAVEFTPFYIQVIPRWFPLLLESGLIKDENDLGWKKFRETKLASEGLMVTVLKPDLAFFKNKGLFMNILKAGEVIWELDKKGTMLPPSLYMVQNIDGYEIGLEIPPTMKQVMSDTGEVQKKSYSITIPYKEFTPYYGKEFTEKDKIEIEHSFQKHGIKRDEDTSVDFPNHLEHEYFDIYYNEI